MTGRTLDTAGSEKRASTAACILTHIHKRVPTESSYLSLYTTVVEGVLISTKRNMSRKGKYKEEREV